MSSQKTCGRVRLVMSVCVLLLPMRMLHAQPESVTPPPAPVPAAPPPETQLIVQQDSPLPPAPPCALSEWDHFFPCLGMYRIVCSSCLRVLRPSPSMDNCCLFKRSVCWNLS